jgi:hypothetical protein
MQVQTMGSIWPSLNPEICDGHEQSSSSRTSETLFRLVVMFWTDISTYGVLESKVTIHFSYMMDIYHCELAYRTAYDYTPYLSAPMWVGRLIILDYALPLHIFNSGYLPASKSVVSRSRKCLCMDIRRRYLQRRSFSPTGYLIERLQHGRAIARREGPRTNISWSLDGQTLDVAGSRITMHEFRQTIHFTLARIEHTTRQLTFDWWSKVDYVRHLEASARVFILARVIR